MSLQGRFRTPLGRVALLAVVVLTAAKLLVATLAGSSVGSNVADTAPPPTAVGTARSTPASAAGSRFTALAPKRLLDTRPGGSTVDGASAGAGPVGPSGVASLTVAGRGGIPSSGVTAVVLNVTAVSPTTPGYTSVYPSGTTAPVVSNLNWSVGQTVANTVIVGVGPGGTVAIYNSAGLTNYLVDVSGWFAAGGFEPVAPARLADTRGPAATIDGRFSGGGRVPSDQSLDIAITGRAGVPVTGVSAVALNITAVDPDGDGYTTVYPRGAPRSNTSNINWTRNSVVPNAVTVKVGVDGLITIYNFGASTHYLVDVSGYFAEMSGFVPLNPVRLYDTRPFGTTIDTIGVAGGPFVSGQTRDVQLSGRGGVSAFGVDAVMVNVTAVDANAPGFAKIYPSGDAAPNASNVNFDRNNVANLAVVKVSPTGRVSLLHDAYGRPGTAHYLLDVVGYFTGAGANGIVLPPFPGRLDYQLGGAYTPAADVNIVSRDRTVLPTDRPDVYDICYINGYQAQPNETAFWQTNHPNVLLRDSGGNLVIDRDFNEVVFDISTATKRQEIADVESGWITECRTRGYEAIEFDNLDTYLRFPAYLAEANTIDMAGRLLALAHTAGLAVAQKNAPELLAHRPAFDFAVVEQCSEFSECSAFFAAYGDHVLMVEYQAAAFATACQQFPERIVLYADVPLAPLGATGHRRQYCTG